MSNERFVTLGTCGRHYVSYLLETGNIALVPWGFDGGERLLADDLVGFLNRMAKSATYV